MGWIITKDKIANTGEPEGSYQNAKGLVGPSNISDKTAARLAAGEGEKFRLLDDDSEVYYYGRYLEDESEDEGGMFASSTDEFQPLDNFGAPNAGCTMIEYKDTAGAWKML